MRVDKAEFQFGIQHYVPPTVLPSTQSQTTDSTSAGNTAQQSTATGSNANTYTAQQQAAQGQALSSLGSVLNGGSISQNLGLPQATWDAANASWQQNAAPILAAQNGAGSPSIAASQSQLDQQLAGMSGQMAMSNYQGLMGQLGNLAFTPVGNQTNQANAGTGTANQTDHSQTDSTAYNPGGALDALSAIIGNTIQSLTF